tara:strand:+ start:646 stop:792 length:147 start_codon:yes stop_codon:yes gene_type:complete
LIIEEKFNIGNRKVKWAFGSQLRKKSGRQEEECCERLIQFRLRPLAGM